MTDTTPTPKWLQKLGELSDESYMAYAGVYQSYAWQQGEQNRIMEFRLPDEYFQKDRQNEVPGGFIISEFMAVVADLDNEGFCHYWKLRTVRGHLAVSTVPESEYWERYLSLGCTEDDSMNHLPVNHMLLAHEGFLHSSSDAWFGLGEV